MRPRIAVIGAGAVGGYVGGHLARTGQDVTLIDPWPAHVEAIRAQGLELEGVTPEESCTVRVDAIHLTELQGFSKQRPVDIAIVAVKSYDTEWATTMIRQYLGEGGFVVSLQNCINEERIAALVGWGRTVGCIAALLVAELHAPGRIRRTVAKGGQEHAVFRLGEVHGRITRRVEELGAMIAAVDSVKVTRNLWGERWSKLCVNGMRNGLSAVTGLGGNNRERNDAARRFSIRLGERPFASARRWATTWSASRRSSRSVWRKPRKATRRRWRRWKPCCWRPRTRRSGATCSVPPWRGTVQKLGELRCPHRLRA